MIMLVKHSDKCGIINSETNPFGQWLNDCTTLKNRHKCVAIGFEMVNPNLKCSMGIFLRMVRVEDGYDKTWHETMSIMFKERVWF